jgi:hypothetical protein
LISTIAPYAVLAGRVAAVTDDEEAELVEEVQALINSPTTTSTDIAASRAWRAVRRPSCVI